MVVVSMLGNEPARVGEHGPSGAVLCFLAATFVRSAHAEEKSFTGCPSTAFSPGVRLELGAAF